MDTFLLIEEQCHVPVLVRVYDAGVVTGVYANARALHYMLEHGYAYRHRYMYTLNVHSAVTRYIYY